MHFDWLILRIYWRTDTDVTLLSTTICFFYWIEQTHSLFPLGLCSNKFQGTSKCGKNISDNHSCALSDTFLFLPHFYKVCDKLQTHSNMNSVENQPWRKRLWGLLHKYHHSEPEHELSHPVQRVNWSTVLIFFSFSRWMRITSKKTKTLETLHELG